MEIRVPYALYDEQLEYVKTIQEAIQKNKPVLIEAGTGFGKTIANLLAILPIAIENNEMIAYLSKTHTQNEQVLLELRKIKELNPQFQLKSVQVASRQQLCHIRAVSKAPNIIGSILCQRNRDLLRKTRQGSKKKLLSELRDIRDCFSPFSVPDGRRYRKTISDIITIYDLRMLSNSVGGCAYLASRDLLSDSLLFTGHYNYFLDPEIRSALELSENVHLILDEGHNLEEIATSIMSESLTMNHVNQALSFSSLNHFSSLEQILREVKNKFEELASLIPSSQNFFSILMEKFHQDFPSFFPENLYEYFSSVYSKNEEKIEEIYQKQSSFEHITSPFPRILNFLEKMLFKGIYENYGLIIEKKGNHDVIYRLVCLDPKLLLSSVFSNVRSVIICSGTLSPLEIHAEILGIPNAVKKSFSAVASEDNVLLLQVSRGFVSHQKLTTRFASRSTEIFDAYRTVLLDLIKLVPGGILAFVPSYSLLKDLRLPSLHDDFEIFQEEPKMDVRFIIEDFRQKIEENGKAMLVGVYGGKFSEGANFPEKQSRAIVCIGIPYPPVNDPVVRLKREYYERKRKNLGANWYVAQAFQKVAQALGRGWRGKNDYAIGLLLDERFGWYKNIQQLPYWLTKRTIKVDNWIEARKKITFFFEKFRKEGF